jgi:hypothetical protein
MNKYTKKKKKRKKKKGFIGISAQADFTSSWREGDISDQVVDFGQKTAQAFFFFFWRGGALKFDNYSSVMGMVLKNVFLFILVVVRFELRVSLMLSRRSITWATLPVLDVFLGCNHHSLVLGGQKGSQLHSGTAELIVGVMILLNHLGYNVAGGLSVFKFLWKHKGRVGEAAIPMGSGSS